MRLLIADLCAGEVIAGQGQPPVASPNFSKVKRASPAGTPASTWTDTGAPHAVLAIRSRWSGISRAEMSSGIDDLDLRPEERDASVDLGDVAQNRFDHVEDMGARDRHETRARRGLVEIVIIARRLWPVTERRRVRRGPTEDAQACRK